MTEKHGATFMVDKIDLVDSTYKRGLEIVGDGGSSLIDGLPMHIRLMIKGRVGFGPEDDIPGPWWRRRVSKTDGKVFELEKFEDYLLLQAGLGGLGLRSLYMVDNILKSSPKYGPEALKLCRQEIPNYDDLVARDKAKNDAQIGRSLPVVGRGAPEGSANNPQGRKGHTENTGTNCNNVTISSTKPTTRQDGGGNSSSYFLRRLAAHAPSYLQAYEQGKYRSVRQAAIAAGIIRVPTDEEQAIIHFTKGAKLAEKIGREDVSAAAKHLIQYLKGVLL